MISGRYISPKERCMYDRGEQVLLGKKERTWEAAGEEAPEDIGVVNTVLAAAKIEIMEMDHLEDPEIPMPGL